MPTASGSGSARSEAGFRTARIDSVSSSRWPVPPRISRVMARTPRTSCWAARRRFPKSRRSMASSRRGRSHESRGSSRSIPPIRSPSHRSVRSALDLSESDAAWIVIVPESAGLSGVGLRKSPALGAGVAPFEHPEVRNWLSFTTERAHVRALVVATGVVTKPGHDELAAVTRPLSRNASVHGHVHAAAFFTGRCRMA